MPNSYGSIVSRGSKKSVVEGMSGETPELSEGGWERRRKKEEKEEKKQRKERRKKKRDRTQQVSNIQQKKTTRSTLLLLRLHLSSTHPEQWPVIIGLSSSVTFFSMSICVTSPPRVPTSTVVPS